MKIKAPAARIIATLLLAAPCAHAQQKPADKPATQTQSATAATQTPSAPDKTATTQTPATSATAKNTLAAPISASSSPMELARAAYTAQGGDKYRALKNVVLLGTADLYSPNSTQSLSGKFYMINADDHVRIEVQSPIFNFTLISDGARTYTSMRGFELPPASRFGVPVLMRFNQSGYVVTALPDKKKERAFRITEPEGMITDFYIDAATGRLLRFEVPYGAYTYGFEFKGVREVDGVSLPTSFVQRISTAQGDFFAEFKVKEAKLNQELPADIFIIPNN